MTDVAATGTDAVFLAPIVPGATGNGLAMRAGMLLEALASEVAVHVVVVPVSGPADDCSWASARAASVSIVDPVSAATARDNLTRQLADPVLRGRLEQASPLPARATLAPPTLAREVAAVLPATAIPPAVVIALRTYLAPLAIELGRRLGAGRVVVDADDDDAAVLLALGEAHEASAFERLVRCWLPEADAVFAASAIDAEQLAARADLDIVGVVPNAVAMAASMPAPPGRQRLIFVGNLTYEPNRRAARLLVEAVLPRVRATHPRVTLDLVGPHDIGLSDLADAGGIRLVGGVPDVAPFYAGADVVTAPLLEGAGTRIKVLEAFAHQRPVVATAAAVRGLDVRDGIEALVTDEDPEALARAVRALLDSPTRGAELVAAAGALLAARYTPAVVAPLVRAAILGADTPQSGSPEPGPHASGRGSTP